MNVAASPAHVPTTLVGATTRNGPAPSVAGVGDQREGLHRLAQPHVVGEDPAEARTATGTPASGSPRAGRTRSSALTPDRLDLGQRLQRPQRLRGLHPLGGLGVDDADLGELVPQAEVVVADPDAAVGLVLQLAGRLDQPGEVRELGPVDADVHAAAQDHPVQPLGERLQHVGQRDRACRRR